MSNKTVVDLMKLQSKEICKRFDVIANKLAGPNVLNILFNLI